VSGVFVSLPLIGCGEFKILCRATTKKITHKNRREIHLPGMDSGYKKKRLFSTEICGWVRQIILQTEKFACAMKLSFADREGV
jgi:hypothetical protein